MTDERYNYNFLDGCASLHIDGTIECKGRYINEYGESFVDFMLESKMCIVNSRVTAGNDDFTSKGLSVVDHICLPHECVTNCVHFDVHNSKDPLTKLNLQDLIGEGCKPPDHAVLELNNRTDFADEHVTECSLNQNITKRYDFNYMSNDFMATPLWAQVCDAPIRRIEGLESTQTHLNDAYADMCSCMFNEMDYNIQYSSQTKPMRKKLKIIYLTGHKIWLGYGGIL